MRARTGIQARPNPCLEADAQNQNIACDACDRVHCSAMFAAVNYPSLTERGLRLVSKEMVSSGLSTTSP